MCTCGIYAHSTPHENYSTSDQEERKLLDTDAVAAPQKALQAQLESMKCSEEALEVLQAQQRMKKNAREEKAAKALARSSDSAT